MFERRTTLPTADGFRMPAEWAPHAGCLMVWPARAELWGDLRGEAEHDYAAVANAIADFEPVLMVCPPGSAAAVRRMCTERVTALELPVDDSWARDSGPAFVRNDAGEVAAVGFRFNAWGERWHPYADDARLAERLARHLDLPWYQAPFVLEGGAFFVDGEGTLVTTEQCLLHANRNPDLTRDEIEQGLRDHLGVSTVVWLPYGHSTDTGPTGTDGHVDGVLHWIAPGHVLLEAVADPASPEHERGLANRAALDAAIDAAGRRFQVTVLDPTVDATVSYANHYLANGAVIVPVGGASADRVALDVLAAAHPDRQVVPVPGTVVAAGGGGPHCITQQIVAGVAF